jgi:5'(3')-deoxyribonucleotidase
MTTLYLDMDGVVADWDRAATEYLHEEFPLDFANKPEGRWPKHLWEELRKATRFYRDLPKMPQADELVELARRFRDEKGYELVFLTAIPRGNDCHWAFYDKVLWVQARYPEIAVHFGPYSEDKQVHCEPGDILVDDRYDNCESWKAAGGVAVRVTKDYQAALDQLQEIFDKNS